MPTNKPSPVLLLGIALLVWLAPILFIVVSNAVHQPTVNYWWAMSILVNIVFYLILITIPYFILRGSYSRVAIWILIYSVIFSIISALGDYFSTGPNNTYLFVMMLFLVVIFIHSSIARKLKK